MYDTPPLLGSALGAPRPTVPNASPNLRELNIRPIAAESQNYKQERHHQQRSMLVGWGERLCTKAFCCDLFSQLAIDGDLFTVWQPQYLPTDQLAEENR